MSCRLHELVGQATTAGGLVAMLIVPAGAITTTRGQPAPEIQPVVPIDLNESLNLIIQTTPAPKPQSLFK